jgi:CelD/BcsL family acetyltransferase involved in cellulose biosynthesis
MSSSLPSLKIASSKQGLCPLYRATVQVTVAESVNDFTAISTDWDRLLAQTGIANINLSHGWLSAWLQAFPNRKLKALLAWQDGELVGAMPLKISTSSSGISKRFVRRLRFIGTDPSVYDQMNIPIHTATASGQAVDRHAVLTAFAQAIQGLHQEWDMVDLCFVAASDDLSVIAACLEPFLWKATTTQAMSLPWFTIHSTEVDYHASKSRNLKNTLKRGKKGLLEAVGATDLHLEIVPPDSVEAASLLAALCERHIAYWAARGVMSDFKRYATLQQFYQNVLRAFSEETPDPPVNIDSMLLVNRPQLSRLMAGDTPVSFHLGFWQNGVFLDHLGNYLEPFKAFSPGMLHTDALVRHAIAMGGQLYQFGRGDEGYKFRWAKETLPLYNWSGYQTPLAYVSANADGWLWQGWQRTKQALQNSTGNVS